LNPLPLITFAVHAEAAPTRRLLRKHQLPAHLLVTGIGSAAALRSVPPTLASRPPFALTCGFAGGLNTELPAGLLVADADPDFPIRHRLAACGARFATFLDSNCILTTAYEKAAARARSQADVVDMESAAIRRLCQEAGIPSATFRVISDAAGEDLPLDFNRFLGHSGQFRYDRLIVALLQSPSRVRALIRFQRQTRSAAEALARGLQSILKP
jgi:adenosylhomocysteine nucleosidase